MHDVYTSITPSSRDPELVARAKIHRHLRYAFTETDATGPVDLEEREQRLRNLSEEAKEELARMTRANSRKEDPLFRMFLVVSHPETGKPIEKISLVDSDGEDIVFPADLPEEAELSSTRYIPETRSDRNHHKYIATFTIAASPKQLETAEYAISGSIKETTVTIPLENGGALKAKGHDVNYETEEGAPDTNPPSVVTRPTPGSARVWVLE